jgi:hypothetical protein
MNERVESKDPTTLNAMGRRCDVPLLDPSEMAVEGCQWVREISFIDGRWITTCHRRGRLVPRHQ